MTKGYILGASSGAKRLGCYLVAISDENAGRKALAKHLHIPASQIEVSEVVDAADFGEDEGAITSLEYW
jgi:hypothetical protein